METDAGAGTLTPAQPGDPAACGRPPRLRRRWLLTAAASFAVLAAVTTAAGYLAIRAHQQTAALARADAAAITAAKDCVSATQPKDVTTLPASQQKLIACSTGEFGTQAQWYGAVLDEAYRAVNIHVELPEMHAAVERRNTDGSIVALVAFRTVISQPGMADRNNGYRVRVRMVAEHGTFKVANLDQVAQ
ncbi:Mce protein [Mycolicibacterium sp.]|uniref:Mce protein n=1 Tax=Mycolicibacterium sp. TaxID=2320850 RepID=UPI0037CBB132